jgi:hypothetical protein
MNGTDEVCLESKIRTEKSNQEADGLCCIAAGASGERIDDD